MAPEKLSEGQLSWFSRITKERMVCLDTEWRETGKKEGGGWEEATYHQGAVCCP